MAAQNLPPPISGGTLIITQDGTTAAAADADRDALWLVDLGRQQPPVRVVLPAGSEPGRLVEDADGKLHVALRRSGQVAKIDRATASVELTRAACAAPRGLAYDATTDDLHVACAGGELVTMKARGGDPTRQLYIDSDLRDVVVKSPYLLISRFRSAELLQVDASGAVVGRVKPRTVSTGIDKITNQPTTASPTTAWGLKALPTGEVLMLHQRGVDGPVFTQGGGGYGFGNCPGNGIVSPGLTLFTDAQNTAGGGLTTGFMSLAVDVAVAPNSDVVAVVGPPGPKMPSVAFYRRAMLDTTDHCQLPTSPAPPPGPVGQPIAAAFDPQGNLWVQSREPATLTLYVPPNPQLTTQIVLPGAESRDDVGHDTFHTPTLAGIACVSCHPEGGDDGHVWHFDTAGARRTQNLRGGLLATAPFHWDGQMTDLTILMQTVLTGRMAGPLPTASQVTAVGQWLDALRPANKAPASDPAAVERGRALFNDATVGCFACHSGAHFTNNQNADVGTGRALQVPSLIDVASRAPYMHTGCAATLRDRFNPACGGGDLHGHTSQLSSSQIDDLVTYLQTL
jgi:mono/diheme cytochrome c family protein